MDPSAVDVARRRVRLWAATLLVLLINFGSLHATRAFVWAGDYLFYVLAGAAALSCLHIALRARRLELGGVSIILGLIIVLGMLHAPTTDFGKVKLAALAVTFFCVALASVVMKTSEHRVGFLWATVGVGVLVLILSIVSPSTDVAAGRVAAEGATTIATGRMVGSALVVVFALTVLGTTRMAVGAVVCLAFMAVMFETGSRGPLVAALTAGAVLVFISFARRPLRALAISGAALVVAWVAWGQASASSQDRFLVLLDTNRGQSVGQREYMWRRAWQVASERGWWDWSGWGNLNQLQLRYDQDPHNTFLEVLVEAGWVAMALLLLLVGVGFVRTFRARTTDPAALPLLGLLVFHLVNTSVSGDVNDRPLWTAVVAAWAIGQAAGGKPATWTQDRSRGGQQLRSR